ncbi:MAG: hypothetical protein QN173_05760 [Armatimonadota bacterium]|nr:hypothetical protein [Armatimonadota bacterium]MDR7402416.1 hypothetical protein [Armatimonadota bacterium]MDR7404244.1 hypothetical protein [Armatimonadota bacterium]MDR7437563.1 hypothetical protein [Armatimonadota bacterium]MDR7472157.1 hypothetical protein [Armatimonadota bacterium]
MRNAHLTGIIALSAVAVAAAAGIVYGEATDRWYLGGALVGVLLIAYAGIVLLLRRMGLIGPRRAER